MLQPDGRLPARAAVEEKEVTSHHIAQLEKQIAALLARVTELERKVAALEKSTPAHLARVERR